MLRHILKVTSSSLLLAFFSSAHSTPFITGVVLNSNGQPLQGAIVHYYKNGVKDTTDNMGRYSIDAAPVSIHRADPRFDIAAKTNAKLYDLGGSLLAQSSNENLNLFLGQSLHELPSGTYFVQAGGKFHKVQKYPDFN